MKRSTKETHRAKRSALRFMKRYGTYGMVCNASVFRGLFSPAELAALVANMNANGPAKAFSPNTYVVPFVE